MTGALTRSFGRALIFAFAATAFVTTPATAFGAGPALGGRVVLPDDVTPDHYRIDITPDAQRMTFKGAVEIDVTVHRATDNIVLNSADIVIEWAALSGAAKAPVLSYDDSVQTVTLAFGRRLKPGRYTLSLEYHGRIYNQDSGLFYLDYNTSNGKARALFTQFENSDARRFVPSWDEPSRKATFQLTATVPADQVAISNMPIASTDLLAGDLKRVHFGTTPKMSSYLLFFGMGDFERVHRDVDGVDVGVVVKRGDTAYARYALDAAADILPYYNHYFGILYPLPKLDLIAGPGSSPFFGAMENWGAIFYFERALEIDPRISTQTDRQNVYITVAHEMAHQWFGNLVTMAWWDDLWLNEGFATWMQSKVTDHFHPEWNVWLRTLGYTQNTMGVDGRDGTHPVVTPINNVLQASGAFDTITYSKGAAVIRTLEAYVGEKSFRAGVRRYMHDHAYGNTVTDDFWREMDKGSTRPITPIAHDFTLQAGVPMISELSVECVNGESRLKLAQGHFAIDADSTTAHIWRVPVTIAALGGVSAKMVVSGSKPQSGSVRGCGTVILNAGQTAYFRSRYSNEGLAAISVHFAALSSGDQLGIFDDSASLAYVGEEPMAVFLNLTKSVPANADPVIASALVEQMLLLDRLYEGRPAQASFRAYARGLLNVFFMQLGWDTRPGEADNIARLRSDLIFALGILDDPSVLTEAANRFARYIADPTSLDAAARRSVLRTVAAHADQATWDLLHGLARSAGSERERLEFYELLVAAQDITIVEEGLKLALSGEPPETTVLQMISVASRLHPDIAFDFTVDHWDKIESYVPPTTEAHFVPGLIGNASDLKLIDKLNTFAARHIPVDGRQDLRKAESNVRYLAKIRQDRLPEVDQWLKRQSG
jgi:aminopeptidase N